MPLMHEAVLAIFNEALAMDEWPENYVARPFEPAKASESRNRALRDQPSSQRTGGQSTESVEAIELPSVKSSNRSGSSKRSRSYRDDDSQTHADPDECRAKRAKQDQPELEVAAHQEAAEFIEKAPSAGGFEDIAELFEHTSSISLESGNQYGIEHYEQSQDDDFESLTDIPPSSPSAFSAASYAFGNDDDAEFTEVERLIDAPSL
ncbi:hypothetical protein WOLCODRAFT_153335 [Wolfiporia cocos MD-104 SS10]|uniref:Uncharacterized protein n=1 Tax=Wolfiporia cocos (strain MD-104) TaxID=742152 RepID=A0A2H3JTJ1_WOLCO|nr:hypothetical protein WOLCODRAFT_153335 [Wolfiporia cocos MD-104 SS10]